MRLRNEHKYYQLQNLYEKQRNGNRGDNGGSEQNKNENESHSRKMGIHCLKWWCEVFQKPFHHNWFRFFLLIFSRRYENENENENERTNKRTNQRTNECEWDSFIWYKALRFTLITRWCETITVAVIVIVTVTLLQPPPPLAASPPPSPFYYIVFHIVSFVILSTVPRCSRFYKCLFVCSCLFVCLVFFSRIVQTKHYFMVFIFFFSTFFIFHYLSSAPFFFLAS